MLYAAVTTVATIDATHNIQLLLTHVHITNLDCSEAVVSRFMYVSVCFKRRHWAYRFMVKVKIIGQGKPNTCRPTCISDTCTA